jgi:hypothetical protein
MADYTSRSDDWAKNVIHGAKHRERYSNDTYWFRGNVFFCHDDAVMRLEKTIAGDWMVLKQQKHWLGVYDFIDGRPKTYPLPPALPSLTFQSIGVHYSYGEGGVMRGETLHWFMHRQMMCELNQTVRWAEEMPIKRLDEYGAGALKTMVEKRVQDHYEYRHKFCQDLPEMPDYTKQVTDLLDRRLAKYNDPKAVAQRARNEARATAKKALGL